MLSYSSLLYIVFIFFAYIFSNRIARSYDIPINIFWWPCISFFMIETLIYKYTNADDSSLYVFSKTLSSSLLLGIYVCACARCMGVWLSIHLWWSEDNFWESVLSFHIGWGYRTQVTRLMGPCICPPSHLADLTFDNRQCKRCKRIFAVVLMWISLISDDEHLYIFNDFYIFTWDKFIVISYQFVDQVICFLDIE